MSIFRIVVAGLFVSSLCRAEVESCGVINDYKQVLKCAEMRSPELLRAEAVLQQKRSSIESAEQFLNPELSFETLNGSQKSLKKSETDVSLAFPVELGGKRSARKDVAKKTASRAELELLQARSRLRKEILLKMARLRQLGGELALVEESLETFTKLVKQYEARPLRSPEQEVSLAVFKMARGEYGLKKVESEEELFSLESYFKLNTGLSISSLRKILPGPLSAWPKFQSQTREDFQSPLLRLYEADVDVARVELNQTDGDAWPTVNVGPSAKFSKEGDQDFEQFGVNLSMPLPILSMNGGNRAVARAAVQSAELKKQLALNELKEDRSRILKSYESSVTVLQQTPDSQTLDKNHRRLEGLFVRGLVSSSLVIEAHRTLVEFEKNRNDRERKALEALFDLQILDGQSVELN